MINPFFSVVIPTYNQANFLKKALKSLDDQLFKNFEIIVIDNCSKDKTFKIVKEFPKKIIYRRINNRGSIARSRNVGIKLSKGKWICFLDSDDYWLPNKLKKVFTLIKKKKLTLFVIVNMSSMRKLKKKRYGITGHILKIFIKHY